jgi:hypothetical protein
MKMLKKQKKNYYLLNIKIFAIVTQSIERVKKTFKVNFIKDRVVNLVNGVKAGDPAAVIGAAGGISLGTSGLVLLLEATFDVTEY